MSQPVASRHESSVPVMSAPAQSRLSWLQAMATTVRDQVSARGAVLLRGLPVDGRDALARAREALRIASHAPTEFFTSRTELGDGVFSPLNWPTDRAICPFQEGSFSRSAPSYVLTACLTPPGVTGRTHLSDTRQILEHLPGGLVDRVRTGGWIVARNFHEGFGISWREAFRVSNRSELDEALTSSGVEFEWLADGALRTVRHLPGVVTHPRTGEECWFNDVSFLNAGNLEPAERRILVEAFGERVPVNTSFGDGSPLSDDDLAAVLRAYESVQSSVAWHRGDLLVVDNRLMAQGRSVFEGSPEFLVALGEE